MSSFVGRGTGARGILFGAIAGLGVGGWRPACSAQDGKMGAKSDPGKVLAVVNGKKITEGDVRSANAQEFQALERQYQQNQHDLLESKVKQMVEDNLLEAEAKAK